MRYFILFLLLSISQSLIAQPQYYNWAMGNCVIKVSGNGVEEVVNTENRNIIGNFSVSDKYGNLSVMGSVRWIMDSSENILEDNHTSGVSRSASIISPFNENHVVVFMSVLRGSEASLIMYVIDTETSTIHYKHKLLDEEFRFLVAVPDSEGSAIWLIVKSNRSNLFNVYKIGEGYTCMHNSVYDCGFEFTNEFANNIITTNNYDKIYFHEVRNVFMCSVDFDNREGVLSNMRVFKCKDSYNFALSPSDRFLFVGHDTIISKYDVSMLSETADCQVPVDTCIIPKGLSGYNHYLDMILGPDGRIYLSSNVTSLCVIENPDGEGILLRKDAVVLENSDGFWPFFPRYPKIKQVPKPCPDMKPPVIRWKVR